MIADSKTIPAVAYYRMSSGKQEKSIPGQRTEVERYAAANGHMILRTYMDEGISGSESDRRDGFKQLMRDAESCSDFEVILCWDQDRFSRFDPLEANHYWFMLRECGVRIVTVQQGELDLGELGGWLVASINQHGKAQYLKDLSANVLRGRLRKAEKGLWAGSRAPYGYILTSEGRLELGDAEHVKAVQFVFDAYANRDISLRQIAKLLNDNQLPSPAGGTWTGAKVQILLRREAYSGKAVQFRESKGKFHTISGKGIAVAKGGGVKPARDWFTMDCPVIIEPVLWDRCHEKLLRRRTRTCPTPNGPAGLLSGLIYCGHCGARMYAASKPVDTSGDLFYCCSTYNAHGKAGCHRNLIHQSALLPFLIERIQELLLAPANIDRLRAEVARQLERKRPEQPGTDKRAARGRLAKLDKDIIAAAAELKRTPDDLYDLAVADLRHLREERDRAASALEALESRVARSNATGATSAEKVLATVQRLGSRLSDADPAVVREALHEVCDRIDLWFDHVETAKLTRSYFRKGMIHFRPPTELSGPASPPRSRRA